MKLLRLPPLLLLLSPAAAFATLEIDALPRWRENLPALQELVATAPLNLLAHESPHTAPPELDSALAEELARRVAPLSLEPGEMLAPVRMHGPETPFPDHAALRQTAAVRAVLTRHALAADDVPAALAHARQNLALARVSLLRQHGIIPLIHAGGVWQSALDSVHSLARHPALPESDARALLAELQADSHLAARALTHAFHGEFNHVFQVVVERMPVTDDPDFLLSAVASLGMAPPEPLPLGELGLGLTDHRLLDIPATLDAYRADLAPYLRAFGQSSPRFPRNLYAEHTAPVLAAHRRELGLFHTYAVGELPAGPLELARARADLIAAENPFGKLLAVFLTPAWEPLMIFAYRREAHRSALCALLAWRVRGGPADWQTLVSEGLLPAPPADPFSDAPLLYTTAPAARVWSVFLDGADDGGTLLDANTGLPPDLVWLP